MSMCTQISTSEFIPALINCIAETKKLKSFIVYNDVLWRIVKELQKTCWVNVNLSYPKIKEIITTLCFAFSKVNEPDFISMDDNSDIKVQVPDDECCKTMCNYFFSTNTKWYITLHLICEMCLHIVDDRLRFQNCYYVKSNLPVEYIEYLDIAYS